MNKVCFVNGSPRGRKSSSMGLIASVGSLLSPQKSEVREITIVESVSCNQQEQDFRLLLGMDSIVFVFPLYIDAIPSSMLDYLWHFDEYVKSHPTEQTMPRLYVIVNNGFVEGEQNINAVQIMRNFASKTGFRWGFGIGIGAGEFVKETKDTIPLKSKLKRSIYEALLKMTESIEMNTIPIYKDMFVKPAFPRAFFMVVANFHWIQASKKSRRKLSKRIWAS